MDFLRRFAFLLLISALLTHVARSQDSNLSILPENLYNVSGRIGPVAMVEPIAVSGESFSQGYRITVSGSSADINDAGLRWRTTESINIGDNVKISFWVRKISPLDNSIIRAFVGFEKLTHPAYRPLLTSFPCDGDVWTKYIFNLKASTNYPAGEAQLSFQFARGPQTFEIGGIAAVNLGPTQPLVTSGAEILSSDIHQKYDAYLDPKAGGSVTPVSVVGQEFRQAFQIAVHADSEFDYLSGLFFNNRARVNKGDCLLLSFWARKLEPSGDSVIKARVNFERNSGNYEKSVSINFPNDGGEWKRYQIPFYAGTTLLPGEARLIFNFGHGPQKFEIGGIRLTDYGQNISPDQMPGSFYYPGRDDADAQWRIEAQRRIDQHRKADLIVNVRDRFGNAIPGAQVMVQQTEHAFRFGSAVVAQLIAGDGATASERAQYRSRVSSHFNTTVLENDLKWPFWEGWESWNRQATIDSFKWLKERNLTVRGHTLIWPSYGNMPTNTRGLPPDELRSRIDAHFAEMLKQENAGGKCYQWDVINEPYSHFEIQGRINGVAGAPASDGLLGNLEMVRWFQNARSLDPQAKLFINDFNVLENAGLETKHQDYIFNLTGWLIGNGAPVDGVGLQGHFDRITPPATLQSIIERFSQLPVSLAITEFDVNLLDEQLQADYVRDVMTMIFSHPKFTDFLMWGFWERTHWLPYASIYRADWSSKPGAVAYNDLVFKEWWTNAVGHTDSLGRFGMRGFKGGYNVIVSYQRINQIAPAIIDSNGEITVTLDTIAPSLPVRRDSGRRIE